MSVSLKILTDSNSLSEIEDNWNQQIENSANNPFLFNSILSEYMKIREKQDYTPLVFSFWSDSKLVGVIPLFLQKKSFITYATMLHDKLYSDIFLHNEFRDICLTKLIDILFNKLNCRLVTLVFQNDSFFDILKDVCRKKGLHSEIRSYMGRSQVTIPNDWNSYLKSLSRNSKKHFRRVERLLNQKGEWNVSCSEITTDSFAKIFHIEKMSWKAIYRSNKNIDQDSNLMAFRDALQKKGNNCTYYGSEVWFLELNGKPIAYSLNLSYNGVSYFFKTSYDKRFSKFSPGKFLLHSTIRRIFNKKTISLCDFITDLPFHHVWKPSILKRKEMYIIQNPILSEVIQVMNRYPQIKKLFGYAQALG